jgi:hypothetical protein
LFDQLIAVVNEASWKNCSTAELQEKIAALGVNVKDAAVKTASIIKKDAGLTLPPRLCGAVPRTAGSGTALGPPGFRAPCGKIQRRNSGRSTRR